MKIEFKNRADVGEFLSKMTAAQIYLQAEDMLNQFQNVSNEQRISATQLVKDGNNILSAYFTKRLPTREELQKIIDIVHQNQETYIKDGGIPPELFNLDH